MLERDGEAAVLVRALAAARRGSGNLVMIDGPAGIGKSRLLDHVTAAAVVEDMGVLTVRGVELEREVPFGVATRLLTAALAEADSDERKRVLTGPASLTCCLLDGAGPAPDPDALVRGLYWAVANLTTPPTPGAPARPFLVAVDDGQWVDRPSLAFLAHLAARVEELPVTLVIAVRSGEATAVSDLLDWLRLHAGSRVLRPAPLSDRAVGRMVESQFPSADPLFVASCGQVSGGNPFLARELVRALDAEGLPPTAASVPAVQRLVPRTVLRSVLVRLARLPDPVSQLAAAVAVLGDDVPLRHAAALADLDAEPAERGADILAQVGIFAPGEPLRFAHSLISTAIYWDLPAFARSRAHRRAADLLATEHATSDTVAAHLLLTRPDGDPGTVRVLREAGCRALTRGDPAAAVHLLERARREPPAGESLAEVLLELARAQLHNGDPGAEETIGEALSLGGDPGYRVRALRALAELRSARGDHEAADRAAQEALSLLPPGDPAAQALLVGQLTAGIFRAQLQPAAVARLAPLLERVGRGHLPEHPGLLAHAALQLAFAGASGRQVRDLAERATAGNPLVEPASHGILAGVLVQALSTVDELDAAEHVAQEALAEAQRRGSLLAYSIASYHRCIPRYHRGALTDALADLDQALTASREGWNAADGWIRAMQTLLLVERGDLAAAHQALLRAPDSVAGSMDQVMVLHARARLAAADLDHAGALAAAEAAGRLLDTGFGIDHPGFLPWRHTALPAAVALHDRDRPRLLSDQALQRAEPSQGPRVIGMALQDAARVGGDDERVPRLRRAVTVLEGSPSKLWLAHALVDLGVALVRAGQIADGQQVLRRGLELSDRLGAVPLAAAARDGLRSTGVRPRRTAITGAAALTPTERRVADLAAGGLTNPQIAQALFVTTKTIQTHLASAYRKLGIHSRAQLGALLIQET
jgi:DNA-binding CsgD family transcriptional regulator/tetratricopeptide (TPR) repeat protein